MTPNCRPIFITGVYRSGSNLLAHMLDKHPAISIWSDCVHYFRFIHDRYLPLENDDNIKSLVCDLTNRLAKRFDFELNSAQIKDRLLKTDRVQATIYNTLMSLPFFLQGKERWGEKVSLAWTRISQFLEMFPKGKILIIIRDPRAVVASWKNETIAPRPLYLDAIFNCLGLFTYLENNKSNPALFYFRFEDFVRHPAMNLKKLYEFLEEPVVLKEADRLGEFNIHKAKTLNTFARRNREQQKIDPQTIHSWVQQIDNQDLALCNTILGSHLMSFGYTNKLHIQASQRQLLRVFENSPEYLRKSYHRWINTGEGHEGYPLDPTKETNWHPLRK